MDLTALLEIVISLAAMFWLLSMISSFLVEAVNSLWRNVRAEALERFVCEMVLGDNSVTGIFRQLKGKLAGDENADPLGILSHGLVRSLRKPSKSAGAEADAPSYIPKEIFAKVLLDRLSGVAAAMGSGTVNCLPLLVHLAGAATLAQGLKDRLINLQASIESKAGNLPALVNELLAWLRTLPVGSAIQNLNALGVELQSFINTPPAALPPAVATQSVGVARHLLMFVNRLLEFLGTQQPNAQLQLVLTPAATMRFLAQTSVPVVREDLFAAMAAVVDHGPLPEPLRQALRPIVANANQDLGQLRDGLEKWFDSVMERATGWFKRNTTMWLGVSGGLLAIAFNINPILMTRDLVEDPALRRAGVAFANQIVDQQGDSGLARRYYFAMQSDHRHWKATIDQLQEGSAKQLRELVYQIQPALLTSGQYVGLLPEVRRPSPAIWQGTERDRFLLRVCVAWSEAQRAGAADKASLKPPESIQDCKRLAFDFGIPTPDASRAEQTTETIVTSVVGPTDTTAGITHSISNKKEVVRSTTVRSSFPASPASAASTASTTPVVSGASAPPAPPTRASVAAAGDSEAVAKNDDFKRFWGSPDIVWDGQLGMALWDALADIGAEAPPKNVKEAYITAGHLTKLKEAFDATDNQARESSRYVNAFINRIPSLGWRPDPSLYEFWDNIRMYGIKILWGLLGWPLTALMVSFGAAFWFDLLSKLMNRRVTGPRPDGVA